jgi:hypothetical protein
VLRNLHCKRPKGNHQRVSQTSGGGGAEVRRFYRCALRRRSICLWLSSLVFPFPWINRQRSFRVWRWQQKGTLMTAYGGCVVCVREGHAAMRTADPPLLAISFASMVCWFSLVQLLDLEIWLACSVDAISVYWTDSCWWWFVHLILQTWRPLPSLTWTIEHGAGASWSFWVKHVPSYRRLPQGCHKTRDHIPGQLSHCEYHASSTYDISHIASTQAAMLGTYLTALCPKCCLFFSPLKTSPSTSLCLLLSINKFHNWKCK